jgi:hypothetical protein
MLMTLWTFIKRLPLWALRETLERLGFEGGKFIFTGAVAGFAIWFMVGAGEERRAIEKVTDWLFFTLPALATMFALFVLWTAIPAIYHFARSRSNFRFEALERNNFVEQFNRALEDTTINGGTF